MTKDEFEIGLKHLKRFLKEQNIYTFTVSRLFYGRAKDKLFDEFNNQMFGEYFKWNVLFCRLNLLGPLYSIFYRDYTYLREKNIHLLWAKYCDINKIP